MGSPSRAGYLSVRPKAKKGMAMADTPSNTDEAKGRVKEATGKLKEGIDKVRDALHKD